MKIFLGVDRGSLKMVQQDAPPFCGLMTYYRIGGPIKPLMGMFSDFILDSGVFTLVYGAGGNVDIWEYADKYAQYVRDNGIRNYVELDMDAVLGYAETLKLRAFLKKKVGWDPIPVWHISRGMEDFKDMCRKYEYASIGGLKKEIGRKRVPLLRHFNDYARKHGCRLHGMGYTDTKQLNGDVLGFYSVDSTTWTNPGKYGTALFWFKNGKLNVRYNYNGCALPSVKAQALSLNEWIKFSKYREKQPYYMYGKDGKAKAYL